MMSGRSSAVWAGAGVGATMGGVMAAVWLRNYRRRQAELALTRWQAARGRALAVVKVRR
jgi:hypothetical protein